MVTGLMEALLVMHLVFYESTALNSPDGSHCLIRAAATNDQGLKAGHEGSQLPGRKQGVLSVSSNVYLMDSAWFLAGCHFRSFTVHAVGSFSNIYSDIENYLEGTKV